MSSTTQNRVAAPLGQALQDNTAFESDNCKQSKKAEVYSSARGSSRVETLMAELWALNMRGNTRLGSSMRKTVRANCHRLPLLQRRDLSLSIEGAEPVNFLSSAICVVAFCNFTVVSPRHLLSLFSASQIISLGWFVVLNHDCNHSLTCQSEFRHGATKKRREFYKPAPRQHSHCNGLHEVRLWGIAIWFIPINKQP